MNMKRLLLPLLTLMLMSLAIPGISSAGIVLSINIAPPELPVYDQPACPGDGYMWTPGYWAYDDDGGYFWVPGTWVTIPEPDYLWTPGFWGWGDGLYVFHPGYWGLTIGFYGGVNYGFGYGGVGYEGGYWRSGSFFYNRSVNNVVNITNVYEKNVVVNHESHVSFNGGVGGIAARPTAAEEAAANGRHLPPTSAQTAHVNEASGNRQLFESSNHGRPPIAATARPSQFSGGGVVQARSAAPSYKPAAERAPGVRPAAGGERAPAENRPATESRPAGKTVHPNDAAPQRPEPYKSGNSGMDQKFAQQQKSLSAKQDQQRQNLQQRQEQEHQKLGQSPQVEQRHQQQTQQLSQQHTQQQQHLQQQQQHQAQRAAPPKEKH